jgi:hypothetical protein
MLSEPKVIIVGWNSVPLETKMLMGIVSPVTYCPGVGLVNPVSTRSFKVHTSI